MKSSKNQKGDYILTDGTGAGQNQNRAEQPSRDNSGGNQTTDADVTTLEHHGQPKSARIAQGGQTGKNTTWGRQRIVGGNSAVDSGELHGQPKARGKRFSGGQFVGFVEPLADNIRANTRQDASGNSAQGEHEKSNQPKATRVKASQRF